MTTEQKLKHIDLHVGRDGAWVQSGRVMARAAVLEELIQLKLENREMTREAALEWALELRRLYEPETV